jgi:hypothetical protein
MQIDMRLWLLMGDDDDDVSSMDFPGPTTQDESSDSSTGSSGYQENSFTDNKTTFLTSNEPISFSVDGDGSFGQQSLDDFIANTETFDAGGAREAAEEAGSAASSIFLT